MYSSISKKYWPKVRVKKVLGENVSWVLWVKSNCLFKSLIYVSVMTWIMRNKTRTNRKTLIFCEEHAIKYIKNKLFCRIICTKQKTTSICLHQNATKKIARVEQLSKSTI